MCVWCTCQVPVGKLATVDRLSWGVVVCKAIADAFEEFINCEVALAQSNRQSAKALVDVKVCVARDAEREVDNAKHIPLDHNPKK